MKKPNQGDQGAKYCLPLHLFRCVISKQCNLDRTSSLNYLMLKPLPTLCTKVSAEASALFFADALTRQTEKF